MLALPFDVLRLDHELFVVDPEPDRERRERLFRALSALNRAETRATVVCAGTPGDRRRIKAYGVELRDLGEDLYDVNPLARPLRLKRRLQKFGAGSIAILSEHGAGSWHVAARLAGVPVRSIQAADGFARPAVDASPVPKLAAGAGGERVLFLLTSDLGRPSAHVTQALGSVRAMAQAGVDVAVAAPGDGADLGGVPQLRLDPVKRSVRYVRDLHRRLAEWRRDGFGTLYFRQVRIASMLLPEARRLGFRVFMEAHQPYTTWALGERARLLAGGPPAFEVQLGLARWDRDYERRVYRQLDGVICTTDAMRRHVRRLVPGARTALLRNGAPSPVSPERPYEEEDRPVDVIYVGRTAPNKGTDLLISALARLPGARAQIVGGPTDKDLAPYRAQAESEGVAERIEFLPWESHERLFDRVRRAKVAVHPISGRGSREWRIFTCPLKILEYMALGTPIVATDLPALREILRPGETAELVPPGSVDALVAGVARLLADGAYAGRLRDAALAEVGSEWSEGRRAERLLEFLRDA